MYINILSNIFLDDEPSVESEGETDSVEEDAERQKDKMVTGMKMNESILIGSDDEDGDQEEDDGSVSPSVLVLKAKPSGTGNKRKAEGVAAIPSAASKKPRVATKGRPMRG